MLLLIIIALAQLVVMVLLLGVVLQQVTRQEIERAALQRMLGELGELKPDYVIFYDLSRVARDDFDALWLLREIEGRGCKLESTLERVDDTPSPKSTTSCKPSTTR
jgi:DNA invertase Pin-like site-specific DNA recombinase